MAEITECFSSYLFANNNPILLNDPLGQSADSVPNPNNITYITPIVINGPSYCAFCADATDNVQVSNVSVAPTDNNSRSSGSGNSTAAGGAVALTWIDETGIIFGEGGAELFPPILFMTAVWVAGYYMDKWTGPKGI